MVKLVAVMLGGALGAATRYWVSGQAIRLVDSDFPWGTLLVNLVGAFLLGGLFVASAEKNLLHPTLQSFLMTGFMGALTTFSTFTLENLILHESGKTPIAIAYLLASITLGLLAVFAGAALARSIFTTG